MMMKMKNNNSEDPAIRVVPMEQYFHTLMEVRKIELLYYCYKMVSKLPIPQNFFSCNVILIMDMVNIQFQL